MVNQLSSEKVRDADLKKPQKVNYEISNFNYFFMRFKAAKTALTLKLPVGLHLNLTEGRPLIKV